jgi:transcriptional repressor NrdR
LAIRREPRVRCPFCHQDDDRVIDSRATDDGTSIRRRRACNGCSKRFTTYERVEGEETLRVIKKDGRIQSFDRRKILHGMLIACEKRPVASEELEAAANRIHSSFLGDGLREVASSAIGEQVMAELHRLDQVAYVRFASVYRQFKDLDDFMVELRRVIGEGASLTPIALPRGPAAAPPQRPGG